MHPEILREMTSQRGREMRARVHEARLARMLWAHRRGAKIQHAADEFVIPAIPDYVDGSFRTEPEQETAASEPGQVTTSHRTA